VNTRFLFILLFGAVTISKPHFSAHAQAATKVEDIYQQHCAACHGDKFQGGLGGDLTDGIWNYGGTDDEIFKSISEGNADLGMTAFKETFNAEQIRSLVVYIREKEKGVRLAKNPPSRPGLNDAFKSQYHEARVELVAEGLDIPWGLAFMPDGRMLVTERAGKLRIVDEEGNLLEEPVAGTPKIRHRGQGGLMEVALHPDYKKNGWIYLGFSDPHPKEGEDSKKCQTAVVRGRIKEGQWVDQEWIYRAPVDSYTSSGVHFGTRFVFHQDYLFFVMGERNGKMEVQDLKNPKGKIYRVYHDGRIPDDNPFVGQPGVEEGVWTYGHRNPQGLALDPRDGFLYSTEHGPRGGDEFNWIRKGANYGWPVITYGMNYNGTPMVAETSKEGMEQPLIDWTPSIAACGLSCYTGDEFQEWKYDFFAGGLASQELWRVRVKGGKLLEKELILKGLGRIRDVRSGPDGYLYLVLNSPGRIVRLVPSS
jgi:glucose/arabinose dehydrogenase